MALSRSPQQSVQSPQTGWKLSLKTSLIRFATACAAVIGLSAMASQEAIGSTPTFADGAYLYGESAQTGTIGSVYFVFQVEADNLYGAIYQPSSSFDCVQGEVAEEYLHLTFKDTDLQTAGSYVVALTQADTTLASNRSMQGQPGIMGMQPLNSLSNLDRNLLDTCQP
jgi:hypothetical protein